MTYSEADLDRLFRAASPVPRHRASRVTTADQEVRDRIVHGLDLRPAQWQRLPRFWAGVATATAAAAAVATLVAFSLLTPLQSAVAVTPPPLQYSSAPALSEVLNSAHARLSEHPHVAQQPRVQSVTWAWNADMAAESVEIVPQKVTFEWGAGAPATATITAAESYWAGDRLPDGIKPSQYRPGDVIDRIITMPEDMSLPPEVVDLHGSDVTSMTAALTAFGSTSQSMSGEVLAATAGLMQYWTLDDAQHATLLDLLSDAGGVTVRGETVDRLGRAVVGLRVSAVTPERSETVFVSVETGRIVGMESELIAPVEGLPLGVIIYTMFDAGEIASAPEG